MSAGLSHLYQSLLRRTPSQDELAGWQGTGLSGQALYDAFLDATRQELASRPAPDLGNLHNYVNANYQQLLGRAPSEQERTAWMGSGLTPEQLYGQMSQAAQAEQQARGFTPTTPTAPTEQSAWLTDFINTPTDQGGLGGLGGLGGTDTGGTDTGGTDTGGDTPPPGDLPFDMNEFFQGLSGLTNSWQQPFQQVLGGWQDAQAQQNQQLSEFRNALQSQQSGFLDTWRQFQTEQQQAAQAAQQNQMQGFQNMLGTTLGAFQNNLGTNSPTFGPGSGGNFGGQISPVYRPNQNTGTDVQARNGWGGPWQSNNPFSPTF